jgi:sugar lactone lactonase YvrE
VIEVIAEHGVGDACPATEVPIGNATDIAVDGAGNVYFVDAEHHRVRRVGTDGVVTTVLNANELGLNRHGITGPSRIALGQDGTLYVADASTGRVWAVIDGTPVYFAGSGVHGDAGDEGPAVDAEFRGPSDVDVGPDGTVFVSDLGSHRIRSVGPDGRIRTLAGGDLPPDTGYFDGVASTSLFQPELIAAAPDGSLYIVDRNGARIQRLWPDGSMEVVPQPGPSVSAIVISGDGHLLVMAGVLWRLKEEGWTRVFSGTEPERFSTVASGETDILAFDRITHRVLRIGADGDRRIVAGNGTRGFFGDGSPAQGASFGCNGVTVDDGGNIYVSDRLNSRIAVIDTGGIINTVAGGPAQGDEAEVGDRLALPSGIALSGGGVLYVADEGSHRVYRIVPGGQLESFAGTGEEGFSGDEGAATEATLARPTDVAVTAGGDVVIVDSGNLRVRRVDSSGIISTLAVLDADASQPFANPERVVPLADGSLVVSGGARLVRIIPEEGKLNVVVSSEADGSDAASTVALAARDAHSLVLFDGFRLLVGAAPVPPQPFVQNDSIDLRPSGESGQLLIHGAFDAQGNLVVCDELYRRVVRVHLSGISAGSESTP